MYKSMGFMRDEDLKMLQGTWLQRYRQAARNSNRIELQCLVSQTLINLGKTFAGWSYSFPSGGSDRMQGSKPGSE